MVQIESEAMQHLERLCVEIGPRPVGSRGNQLAANYIQRAFAASGLAVETQEFACPLWEDQGTRLEMNGRALSAVANWFSPPCDAAGPFVVVGTIAELEAAELGGQIAVLHGDLTKGTGLSARGAVYFPEHDQAIIRLLEQKRPSAAITVNEKTGSAEPLIRDWQFTIPSATVSAEVGLFLLQKADRTLRLRIESQRTPSHFSNVVARTGGARPGRMVLCAHFDTAPGTPGASDNATGVAILLTLAGLLARRDLAVAVEWIALNGEENGGVGDAEYLRRSEDTLEDILFLINVDGAGQWLGANSVVVMGASQALEQQVRALHNRYPGMIWSDPWYESDHSAYLWLGVPVVPISSSGSANVHHLPSDTLQWVSAAKMEEVISFTIAVVESLQYSSPDWCRRSQGRGEG